MTTAKFSSASSDHTTHPSSECLLEDQLARVLAKVPPIIRLPKPGARCPHTQLSRTGLTELIAPTARNGHKPPVKAIYQRAHRYAQRGTWLIPAENLFRYLLGRAGISVDEYHEATGRRVSADEEKVSPVSRNTQRKGNKLPLLTASGLAVASTPEARS